MSMARPRTKICVHRRPWTIHRAAKLYKTSARWAAAQSGGDSGGREPKDEFQRVDCATVRRQALAAHAGLIAGHGISRRAGPDHPAVSLPQKSLKATGATQLSVSLGTTRKEC